MFFFVSKSRRNREHSVRFTFFDFDLCPDISPDIDILKLHYSMSDFPKPWMNTAQTPSVVCFGHTVNISTIFRLFKAILWVKIGLRNFGAKFKFRRIFTKIADISTQRSKSKNVNRTGCSSFIFLLDAKNRLSISEVVSSEYVQKVWVKLKKNYLSPQILICEWLPITSLCRHSITPITRKNDCEMTGIRPITGKVFEFGKGSFW